ncbi:hypothetical protein XENORESO_003850 [Xenotaenia resolanae]|uniref:Uncharacterized protein n=1 Tax=Xenotaenia resolanae TaxID=208358 RepID=A0ABV0VSA2_9TELE
MGVKKPPYQVVEIKPSLALQQRMTYSISGLGSDCYFLFLPKNQRFSHPSTGYLGKRKSNTPSPLVRTFQGFAYWILSCIKELKVDLVEFNPVFLSCCWTPNTPLTSCPLITKGTGRQNGPDLNHN